MQKLKWLQAGGLGLIVLATACTDNGGDKGPHIDPPQNEFSLGGNVSGLQQGKTVVVKNGGGNPYTIAANGAFQFPERVPKGGVYDVSVVTQPTGQYCAIVKSKGKIASAAITNLSIICYDVISLEGTLRTVAGSGEVSVAWADVAQASHYNMYVTSGAGFKPGPCATEDASMPDFQLIRNVTSPQSVTGLTNGKTYYFVLEAVYPSERCTHFQQALARPGHLVFDGAVASIAVGADGAKYIGGAFTRIGAYTGGGIPLHANYSQIDREFPLVDGAIRVVAADGLGGWYIGGSFSTVGEKLRKNLAHILADGSVDDLWAPDVAGEAGKAGEVNALVLSGEVLYIGGSFSSIQGMPRQCLAAFGADGNLTNWAPHIDTGVVYSLAASEEAIYIGGNFTGVDGQVRTSLAAVDAGGGLLAWDPNVTSTLTSSPQGTVLALAVIGGTVYAGGEFSQIGGTPRNRLAAIGTDGKPLASWDPNPAGWVYALAVSGDTVYVGGDFTQMVGQPRQHLAAIGADGSLTDWNPKANDLVLSLAVSGTTVYAGGGFTRIGSAVRNRLAAIYADGSPTAWDPNPNDNVLALAVSGDSVYAGGVFTGMGGTTRNHLAAIDAKGALTAWNPDADNRVGTLVLTGDTLYAGGDFTHIGGQTRHRLAAIAIGDGSLTPWNPGADSRVNVLALSGTTVYAGGHFTQIGATARNRLAAIGTEGTGTLLAWDPNANNAVYALAVSGNTVYAGGSFTSIGVAVDTLPAPTRNRLAAISTEGAGVLQNWDPNANSPVHALAVSGDTVYVGGAFTTMGAPVGTPPAPAARNRLAAIAILDGSLTPWNPNANHIISSLVVSGSTVYAAGSFTSIGAVVNDIPAPTRNHLAAIDINGTLTAWNPAANSRVSTLAVSCDTIYAGGHFTSVGGLPSGPIAAIAPDSTPVACPGSPPQ